MLIFSIIKKYIDVGNNKTTKLVYLLNVVRENLFTF